MHRFICRPTVLAILMATIMALADVSAARANAPYAPSATVIEPSMPALGYIWQETYITAEYSDADGLEDLIFMNLLIGENTSGDFACAIQYHGLEDQMKLWDGVSSSWIVGSSPGSIGVVLESPQCILDVEKSTVTHIGTDTIQVRANITFKPDFMAGDALQSKNAYLWAGDAGGLSTGGWLDQGTFALRPPAIPNSPTAALTEPSLPATSYAGQETYITVEFSDANGRGDLVFMNLLVNEDTGGDSGCIIRFHGVLDRLDLRNDDSTAWQPGDRPGAPGITVENSQCILNVEKSSVVPIGQDTLRVRVHLTFKEDFITAAPAAKSIYLWAGDSSGLNTGGWLDQGTLTIHSPQVPTAPTATFVEPQLPTSTYVDQDGYVTVDFSDANGWQDLIFMNLQINEDTQGGTGCIVQYHGLEGLLKLRNDFGDAWLPGQTPGAAGVAIENDQCILNIEKSSIEVVNPTALRVRSHLTFKPGFIANGGDPDKIVNLWAGDASGLNTGGWLNQGIWTVLNPALPTPPQIVSITPEPPATLYTDEATEIVIELQDANGAQDIRSAFLQINEDTAGESAVMIWYLQDLDRLYLRNDDGTAWFSPGISPGTSGATLENSQVRLDIESSSVEPIGDTLTLHLYLSFKESFIGEKNLYLAAADYLGQTTPNGWVSQGSVIIEEPLMVCLMGDPQFGFVSLEDTKTNADIAMNDLELLDHSALFIVGDLAQDEVEHWDDYEIHIENESLVDIFPLAGNSDLTLGRPDPDLGLAEYQRRTESALWYSVELRGIRFIVLSTTELAGNSEHICGLGAVQLAWLTEELEADTEITTVILFHAPMLETSYGSDEAVMYYLQESAAVRNLMRTHPNVATYANGHVHIDYGNVDDSGRGHFALKDGVMHLSIGATAKNRGSSCLYIFQDQIVSRVRNHQLHSWRPEFEVGIVLPTTLEPSLPNP